MKVLVVSRVAWNSATNFGNTYSTLFGDMENTEIAHIYFGGGTPDTPIASRFFRVSETDIVRRLLRKCRTCGKTVECEPQAAPQKNDSVQSFGKKHRLTAFFAARDLLFQTGVWKTEDLKAFVTEFAPDVIFAPLYGHIYMHPIDRYIAKLSGAPLVSFVSDDIYSLKQYRFSPFYWLYRFALRRQIRKTVAAGEKLFVISELQKAEYEKAFHKPCTVLYKGADFSQHPPQTAANHPLKICFTGNLSSGRWKTVAEIAKAIQAINQNGIKMMMEIYSVTPLTDAMRAAIEVPDCSVFKGAVSGQEALRLQGEADILLHCEGFEKREKYEVRLSFSTKIVDYFSKAKCIFAVGDCSVASMDYLIRNDAAVTACSTAEILEKLSMLAENPALIDEYAEKAWQCGARNHDIYKIRTDLYTALKNTRKG